MLYQCFLYYAKLSPIYPMDYQRWGSGVREATPIAKCDKTGKKERQFTQSLTTTFGCWNLYPKRVFIIQFAIWSPCFVSENPSPKISRRVSSFGCLSFPMIGLTTFLSGCQWSSTYQPVHHIHISHLQIGCIIAIKKKKNSWFTTMFLIPTAITCGAPQFVWK